MNDRTAIAREAFLRSVFPNGVPLLWCPPLTHYDSRGFIDKARMAAHLRHMFPHVRGFLIPGSTGDGWELTSDERRRVLEIGLEQARALGAQVLIGALHPDSREAQKLICQDLEWLQSRTSARPKALAEAHVCGFTVCAQRGSSLSQDEISQSLASILDLGLPTAIYQLPQVTLNEISPSVMGALATRYENFVFFKDTSGSDAVVLSGGKLSGVFTARGAEGDYARWPKSAGGPYDGFLLSSANCFARELGRILDDLSAGKREEARRLSDALSRAVTEVFGLAASLPDGNPFANGNKAMDHFFAHGAAAADVPPPRLHAGSSLPQELICATGEILVRQGLMPAKGYLG